MTIWEGLLVGLCAIVVIGTIVGAVSGRKKGKGKCCGDCSRCCGCARRREEQKNSEPAAHE